MYRRKLEAVTFAFCTVLVLPLVIALVRLEDPGAVPTPPLEVRTRAARGSPTGNRVLPVTRPVPITGLQPTPPAPSTTPSTTAEPVHTANRLERR